MEFFCTLEYRLGTTVLGFSFIRGEYTFGNAFGGVLNDVCTTFVFTLDLRSTSLRYGDAKFSSSGLSTYV